MLRRRRPTPERLAALRSRIEAELTDRPGQLHRWDRLPEREKLAWMQWITRAPDEDHGLAVLVRRAEGPEGLGAVRTGWGRVLAAGHPGGPYG